MSINLASGENLSALLSTPIAAQQDGTVAFWVKRPTTLYDGAYATLFALSDDLALVGDDSYISVSVKASDRLESKAVGTPSNFSSDFVILPPAIEMNNVWVFVTLTFKRINQSTYEVVLRVGSETIVYSSGVRWLESIKSALVIGDVRNNSGTFPFDGLIAHFAVLSGAVFKQAHHDQGRTKIPLDAINTTDLTGTGSNWPLLEYFKLGADLQSEVSATVLTHSGTAVFSADNPFIDTSLPVTHTQVGNVGIVMVNNTRGEVKSAPIIIQSQSTISEQLFAGKTQLNSISEVQ